VVFGLWSGYRFLSSEFPEVSRLKREHPVVRYHGRKRPITIHWSKGRPPGWTPLSAISKPAVGAVVVSEDWAFYRHPGYDAAQIKEAIGESLESGSLGRGASTITQQVTRNVFLTQERSLWRKLKELVLAIRLEREVGKARILETYFNIAEWGAGVYGIGPAAWHYFSKSPSELTPREGAFLAMLLPSPRRYSQSFRDRRLTPFARRTVKSILNKMAQAQYITAEERDLEQIRYLSFEDISLPESDSMLDQDESLEVNPENEEESTATLTPVDEVSQTEEE